ncbi:MAG: penicillin acylase family protein [Alphaproteobacteria bacterium]|nr:penicillin acylase family protein [Alphaproteobacteria bacterium]
MPFVSPHDMLNDPVARKRVWIASAVLVMAIVMTVIGIGGGMYFRLKQTVPNYSGTEQISGMKSLVNVYHDKFGIPHIFAENRNDALRALGYLHANERMFQMEITRRAGQGRLSEVVGASTLDADKLIRVLNLYGLAQDSVRELSPEARNLLQAYADGVNAWIEHNKSTLPLELMSLEDIIEPWQIADSLVIGKLMALQHSSKGMKMDALRSKLSATLNRAQFGQMFPLNAGDTPVTLNPRPVNKNANTKKRAEMSPLDFIGDITGFSHAASNEWVISGKLTDTGKPILANDPHLGFDAPVLWFLTRIVVPGDEVKGATVPGTPVVMLGQNSNIAWGFTNSGFDVQDLFIETIDKKDDDKYLTPKGSQSFVIHNEVISVKGGGDVKLSVRSTRHGPVLSDVNPELAEMAGKGKVMALAFSGLHNADTTAEAMLRINVAKNWGDFLDAVKLYQTPAQNMVYADVKGNIGFISPGWVPVRKQGNGMLPVDGASGNYDWMGFIPFKELPQTFNPAAGYLFNANNAVAGINSVYRLGSDWEEPWRAIRIQQFFETILKHTVDTSVLMQSDHLSPVARDIVPRLVSLKPKTKLAADALELLRRWDGVMSEDKPEPLIFDAWLYFMQRNLFKDLGDISDEGPLKADLISQIIGEYKSNWCSGKAGVGTMPCDEVMIKSLDNALGWIVVRQGSDINKWRWGKEHHAIMKNRFFSKTFFFDKYSDFEFPSSGDFYTLDRGGSFKMEEPDIFPRKHGGGFRGIYDLGNMALSRFMIATGQSGHILSPHYGDLLPMWREFKYVTISGTPEELAKQGAVELKLVP